MCESVQVLGDILLYSSVHCAVALIINSFFKIQNRELKMFVALFVETVQIRQISIVFIIKIIKRLHEHYLLSLSVELIRSYITLGK
jgi:hypothetical protein